MCKWCEDQSCYYTSTSSGPVLVTLCPLCGKTLQKKDGGRNFLEVPRGQSSIKCTLPDINDRGDTIVGKSKDCNLSNSYPSFPISSSSSSPRSHDHSPNKLPPISGCTQKSPSSQSSSPSSLSSLSSSSSSMQKPLPARSAAYLKQEADIARKTNDWTSVEEFFADVQSTVTSLSCTFKLDDREMNTEKIFQVYNVLVESPESVHRVAIKTLISCLLTQQLPQTQELVDALFVAFLNPLFCNTSNYLVFAHVLRRLSLLQNQHLYQVVNWLTRLPQKRFKNLLVKIQDFISCRLFPSSENQLPPIHKAAWWVPSAVKVIALLRAANDLSTPRLASYQDFYVSSIDHLNLLNDYNAWQDPSTQSRFSFCQYPFVISINAKRKILQQDSEQQMISVARNVLLAEVQSSGTEPNIDMLFLNLNVRRSHLVSDSLEELSKKRKELKKKLKVSFMGEPGLDMGGLKKEWFLLLTREIFQPHYGMFKVDNQSLMYWFCNNPKKGLQEYNLVGKLMGLAVYNGINLDVRFPAICYKKLLSPAIVPYNDPHAVVGIVKVTLGDIIETIPSVGKGLKELLEYDGNVDEDFCLSFQITVSDGNNVVTKNLKENGGKIPVTNANRKEYIGLYMDFLFNKNIYHQFQAFYLGFHSVCASNALIMLQPEEVELLVGGNPVLDMSALRDIVVYDGFSKDDETIKHFWTVVLEEFTEDQQKQLLSFTTGSDRLPAGGIGEMEFKISRYDDPESLPMSHTCFNQLILPNYKDKKLLKEKLTIAIQNAEGFGLK